jgi:adenylate cyclase
MSDALRMSPELLPAFRQQQTERLLITLRVSLFAGALISPIFMPWAHWHDPSRDVPSALILGVLMVVLATMGGLTFLAGIKPYLGVMAVVASLYTCLSVTVLHMLLPDGFLVGVGMLLTVMVVTTVLSVDLRFVTAISLPAILVAIPNVAMVISGAPFLTIMNTNWILVPAALLSLGLAYLIDRAHRRSFLLERALAHERDRSEQLLRALLPSGVAEQLKRRDDYIAEIVPDATVAFADLVGFTALSERLSAQELIAVLTEIFTELDEIAMHHGLEKIKTIGDAYMIAAGVADAVHRDATAVAEFSFECVRFVRKYAKSSGLPLDLRVGIASGTLVSGVIGRRRPHFDLWGTTVNRASRLEDSAPDGTIHLDMATADQLRDQYRIGPCRTTELYGIGQVETCLLLGQRGEGGKDDEVEAATITTS